MHLTVLHSWCQVDMEMMERVGAILDVGDITDTSRARATLVIVDRGKERECLWVAGTAIFG